MRQQRLSRGGSVLGAPANRSIRLRLNGSDLTDLALPGTADWNTWNTVTTKVFLPAGISRLEANAYAGDDRDAVNLDYLDVASTTGTITGYEAEASGNTLSGTAARGSNSGASGGQHVGFIGTGAGNTLRFNNVNVPTAGRYRMVVAYANAEVVGDHQYNNNIVDRGADISVNGGTARRTYFRNTLHHSGRRGPRRGNQHHHLRQLHRLRTGHRPHPDSQPDRLGRLRRNLRRDGL